ncbi:MAG: hypothetical protein KF758_05650 [Anaerolineales bacterium]|nr:hypothetical protein [Anaerolineales bacterium]MBX3036380.1 hypothetical protein [Anaerolineales bacterium]
MNKKNFQLLIKGFLFIILLSGCNIFSTNNSLSYEERLEKAKPLINGALESMARENYIEAVQQWDEVINLVPEYAEGYYQRGNSYLSLMEHEYNLEEYKILLNYAKTDIDSAIALSPSPIGNYYFARYSIYDYLASIQETRAEFIPLEEIALENLLLSYKYGTTEPLANRNILFVLYVLGRCDDMLVETQKQIEVQTEPSATLNLAIGLYYYCIEDFETAVDFTAEAVRIGIEKKLADGFCQRSFDHAKVLYSLEKYDEALNILQESFILSPNFCGYRYYLQGLIHATNGDIQNAEKDLTFGMTQTWSRGGLLPYAQAKIALHNGDTETAISLLQKAEATYHIQDPMLKMIQTDLENLGGTRLEIFSPTPFVTPMQNFMP